MSTTLSIAAPAVSLALVPATPALRFVIPPEDGPEFWGFDYCDKVRAEVQRWLHILSRVAAAGNGRGVRVKAMQAEARLAQVSFGTVRAKWYAYADSGGDWRVLVRRSLKGSGQLSALREQNLPAEFRDEIARIAGNNKRSFAAARKQLVAKWRRWRRHGRPEDAIPGYRTPPEPDEKGRHPHGWSPRNLYRFVPKKAHLALDRIGTAAALEHLPCIPGTREGMRYLEYVSFDDVWADRKVCVPGLLDPRRLLQLGAFDLASGCMLKVGVRPETPSPDADTRERLKKQDMLLLVAAFLSAYGYPLDYAMHLILERGTATLAAGEAKALYDYTGGKIVCGYTEMSGRFVMAWDESRKGNPHGKGHHESWHNLYHNWSASEAGQMGKDRDHTPAVLAAQEKEARQLNTVALVLSDEQRAKLKLPFPTLDQAHERVLQIVDEINDREDHACEGFKHVTWWRIKGVTMDWQPEGTLASVPEAARGALEYDSRVETPRQRMLRLSQGVRVGQVPGSLLRSFVEDCRVIRRIERALFSFKYEGKNYDYLAPTVEEALPEGTVLTGHFSPLDMTLVHLTDAAGMFVGTWKRYGPFGRGSGEAAEGFRVRGAYLAEAERRVKRTHAPDLAAEAARMDANLAVVAEAGLIPVPAARTLADVGEHCNSDATALQQAIDGRRREAKRQADEQSRRDRRRVIPADDFSPEAPAPDHAGLKPEPPAAENGEGFADGPALQHQPDSQPRRRIIDAAEFC